MPRRVFINWTPSSFTGWGVYGLNLLQAWTQDPEMEPICTQPIPENQIVIDPLQRLALWPTLAASAAAVAQLEQLRGGMARVAAPALLAVDAAFTPGRSAHDTALTGDPDIGVVFLESSRLDPAAVARARLFSTLVAGSSWNAQVLRAHGLAQVQTVLQGVDPILFRPGPRHGWLKDRFLVFSGGKLERRKGQDIALAAFARFAARRPDAVLVTAWRNAWPELTRSVDRSGLAPPLPFGEDGRPDLPAWAAAAGLAPGQFLDLGHTPNSLMPQVLREIDVAIFPNRAEGGTNLVAMECMACGAPTVLSRNTGHLDLIEDGNCYLLERQGELEGPEGPSGGVCGWGESDVDELVDRLEQAYLDREDARRRGARAAETLSRLTWAETARRMKQVVSDHTA